MENSIPRGRAGLAFAFGVVGGSMVQRSLSDLLNRVGPAVLNGLTLVGAAALLAAGLVLVLRRPAQTATPEAST